MERARLQSVTIENIKGIESAHFEVGTLTVIHGKNGAGKTSILDAIAAVFEGGHDPDLIRQGAECGRVTLKLEDGATIKKTIHPGRSQLDITTGDGLKVTATAAYVKELSEGFSFDPISFLDAPAKKRAEYLLEAMPISFSPEEVGAITGIQPRNELTVEMFDAARKRVYDERTQANVRARELAGWIDTSRRSLPPDDGTDWSGRAAELREALTAKRADLQSVNSQIEAQLLDTLAELKAEYDAKVSAAREAAAKAEREETSVLSAEIETLAGDVAEAEAKRDEWLRAEQTRKQLDDFGTKFEDAQRQSEEYTKQLAALDDLKKQKLSESAITGLELRDGEVFVDGIPLDEVNTQRQYFVAFQLAALRPGRLPLMVCDRAESMVGDEWEAMKKAASESGFQVIMARAESAESLSLEVDGELVEVAPAPEAAAKGRGKRGSR